VRVRQKESPSIDYTKRAYCSLVTCEPESLDGTQGVVEALAVINAVHHMEGTSAIRAARRTLQLVVAVVTAVKTSLTGQVAVVACGIQTGYGRITAELVEDVVVALILAMADNTTLLQ
jgi:hypothetical protein